MTALMDRPVHTTAVSYEALTAQLQNDWDQLEDDTWALYQQAVTQPVDHTTLQARHALFAARLGVHLGAGDELARCDCEGCPDGCDNLTPLRECAVYTTSLGQQAPQCGTCAHDHRHISD